MRTRVACFVGLFVVGRANSSVAAYSANTPEQLIRIDLSSITGGIDLAVPDVGSEGAA
jgi:hypothetical protein